MLDFVALANVTNNITSSSEAASCDSSIPVNIPFVKSISGLWVVWSIALLFVILSWVVSIYLIYKHLKYYTQPEHQRYIVRLLCMVPLYSLYSLLSLILHQHQTYFAIARDCYEAYALFMFFKLCVSYGGGKDAIVEHFLSQPKQKLTFPLGCWKVQPNELFYTVCKQGMLQYVLVRPIVSIWAAVLQMFGAYGDGSFSVNEGYFYASVIDNVCVCIALYIVVLFEQAAKELLHPYRPILKFLSVKMVIFLAFWQSIVIAFMAHFGWIPSFNCLSQGDVATGLQNFLMCFEMFLVALLHIVAYPYELYRVRALTTAPIDNTVKNSVLKNMVNMMNQADLLKDTLESLAVRRPDRGTKDLGSSPPTAGGIQLGAHHAGTGAIIPSSINSNAAAGDESGLLADADAEPTSGSPPGPAPGAASIVDSDFDPRGGVGRGQSLLKLSRGHPSRSQEIDEDDLLDELDDEDLVDYEHLKR